MLRLRLIVVAVAASVSVAGCVLDEGQVDPTKLAALKKEPLATMRPPGGKLVLESELEADGRPSLYASKPTDAHLVRVFAYSDPARARKGLAAVLDAARASGWKLHRRPEAPVFGRKLLATGGITLITGTYEDEDDGFYKVSMRLEHHPCGKGRCR